MTDPNVETFATLFPLPPGSVTGRGWIREQLLRSKEGMGGSLDALEPDMIARPYIDQTTDDGWGATKTGWGAEVSGNYWYGLVMLAFTLDDEELKDKARAWVSGAMAAQHADGYLGAYTGDDDRADDYNAWGTGCGLSALIAYYEATSDPDVLVAVHRCLVWFCENWAGDKKTRYAGQYICFIMAWCYRHVGDARLVAFIEDYVEFLNRNDLYLNSQSAMRSPGEIIYNSNHAATAGLLLGGAATAFMVTGKSAYLEAAQVYLGKLRRKLLLPNGGLASNSEYFSPIASNTETEFCTFSFFQSGLIWLGAISGDPECFDLSERIVFNGSQGARKSDEKCVAYFSSPNQIFATSVSDFYGLDYGAYAACHPISCCPVTSIWTVPQHLFGMALVDGGGGLYIASYGPARITFEELVLETDTSYPFRDDIQYRVSTDEPTGKAIHFRVPGWCDGAEFRVNGDQVVEAPKPGTWVRIERTWTEGDIVDVRMPMAISTTQLNDSDSWGHRPVVVEYGPLVLSLPIPEVWEPVPGTPRTPLPDGWSWYDVKPELIWDTRGDVFEQHGLRKHNISWNVAIDERLTASDFSVTQHEISGYVWERPPITVTVPGYKALYSYAPYIQKTHEVYQAPIDVQEELTLTLVPYGCTNLRITCFPRANVEALPSFQIASGGEK